MMLGLAAGNFLYQGMIADVPQWWVATERSFFQAIAILLAWWIA